MSISSKTKIVVGISQRIDKIEGRDETRDALDQSLVRWVISAGFLPVIIPNVLHNSEDSLLTSWLEVNRPNALILSGGNDIGDFFIRDETERYLLSWAEENDIRVLGICRGMQMMSEWAGAKLIAVTGHVRTRHQLVSESKVQWPASVNSYHNLKLGSCPVKFEIIAQTVNGDIEAIRHTSLAWEGWMWHPERETPFNLIDTINIQRLFCEE